MEQSSVRNINKHGDEKSTSTIITSLEALSISDLPNTVHFGDLSISKPKEELSECSSRDIATDKNNSDEKGSTQKCPRDQLEEELKCIICSEIFIRAITLNCSHSFCQFCISTWRKEHSTCPLCRKEIFNQTATSVLDNCVEKIIEFSTEEIKMHRNEIIEKRNKQKDSNPEPNTITPCNDHGNSTLGSATINDFLSEDSSDDEEVEGNDVELNYDTVRQYKLNEETDFGQFGNNGRLDYNEVVDYISSEDVDGEQFDNNEVLDYDEVEDYNPYAEVDYHVEYY